MGLLEDLSSGKYNLVLFAIIFIFMFHQYWCVSTIKKSQCKEKMTNISNDINVAISRIYKADVEAIRNLADLSKKIQEDGLTIPGNLTVGGTFNYLPKGSIIAYNQISAPKGWAICDGNNSTPDLRGRFIFGNGGSRGMNTTGGAENVTLNENHMPSHNHSASGSTDSKGGKSFGGAKAQGNAGHWHLIGVGGQPYGGVQTADDHTHNLNINVGYNGGNQPHENMPPFYVLTYIMKL